MEEQKNRHIQGKVVHGFHLGREFGVATANLDILEKDLNLKEGVYFVLIQLENSAERKKGLLHIGNRKTMGKPFSVEIHVLDFEGDLYGQVIEIEILKRRRNVRKFETIEDLFTQIRQDIVWARKYFLRRVILDVWKKTNDFQRLQMGNLAIEILRKNKYFRKAQKVFLFAPTRDEINFVQNLCSEFKEKQYFFPKIQGKDMNFYGSNFEDLRPGSFGILEPEKGEMVIPQKGDLFIVPAMALDRKNHRLGRGAGYYDIFLQGKDVHTLSLVPHFALVNEVPTESHDIPVDEVIVVEDY